MVENCPRPGPHVEEHVALMCMGTLTATEWTPVRSEGYSSKRGVLSRLAIPYAGPLFVPGTVPIT